MCEKVLLYASFADGGAGAGLLGRLSTTNFRVSFRPAGGLQTPPRAIRRCRLWHDRFDIPLALIDQLHVTTLQEKKYRLLTAPLSGLEQVCDLKLVTTDWRVLYLSFKNSQFAGQLINQIVYFSHPPKLAALFTCRLGDGDAASPSSSFNSHVGWEDELSRTGAGAGWRVSRLNARHSVVPTFPEALVVPSDLTDARLERAAEIWALKRFPVWCWSSMRGAAIIRSAETDTNSRWAQEQREYLDGCIRDAHPRRAHPKLIQPTITRKEIAAAFVALRKLCAISTWAEFLASEEHWNTRLENSGWLQLVSRLLDSAALVVASVENDYTAVIREPEGLDLTAAVASLAQLCLDPVFRTVPGFCRLIQKEWCALGHPFGERLFGLSEKGRVDEGRCPVFLLFLDAVGQLRRRFSSDFGFSDHFLVALWDLALAGVSATFSANSMADRAFLANSPSAWHFPLFFGHQYRRLFFSALYKARHEASAITGRHIGLTRPSQILHPKLGLPLLQLWTRLFLRWTAPAQVMNGGELQTETALERLRGEIAAAAAELGRDGLSSLQGRVRTADALGLPSGWPYSLHAPGLLSRGAFAKPRQLNSLLQRRASWSEASKPRSSAAVDAARLNHTASPLSLDPQSLRLPSLQLSPLTDRPRAATDCGTLDESVEEAQSLPHSPVHTPTHVRTPNKNNASQRHRFVGKTEADLAAAANKSHKFSTSTFV